MTHTTNEYKKFSHLPKWHNDVQVWNNSTCISISGPDTGKKQEYNCSILYSCELFLLIGPFLKCRNIISWPILAYSTIIQLAPCVHHAVTMGTMLFLKVQCHLYTAEPTQTPSYRCTHDEIELSTVYITRMAARSLFVKFFLWKRASNLEYIYPICIFGLSWYIFLFNPFLTRLFG